MTQWPESLREICRPSLVSCNNMLKGVSCWGPWHLPSGVECHDCCGICLVVKWKWSRVRTVPLSLVRRSQSFRVSRSLRSSRANVSSGSATLLGPPSNQHPNAAAVSAHPLLPLPPGSNGLSHFSITSLTHFILLTSLLLLLLLFQENKPWNPLSLVSVLSNDMLPLFLQYRQGALLRGVFVEKTEQAVELQRKTSLPKLPNIMITNLITI